LLANGLRVVCDQATDDMAKGFSPMLDEAELVDLIQVLRPEHFIESEQCATSYGMTLDCDAYAIRWDRRNRREWAHGAKVFVKFGFRENNGRCFVVSIHPARW
jgi:hypothetical protein